MISAVGATTSQILPKSGAAGLAQEIRNLQTQVALLKQNLGQAEQNAATKEGAVAVQQLRTRISTFEARIARLNAQVVNESNSLSMPPAGKPVANRAKVRDGTTYHLIDIYA